MRLSVDHRTIYRFSAPQDRLVQLLRLTPEDSHHQTVAAWRIDVDRDARLRHGRDGFGNRVTMLYAEGPIDAIEITVTGEVLTSPSNGVLAGIHETVPPGLFLRATPLTPRDADIACFAHELGGDDPLDRLHRLNTALHERIEGQPDGGTPHRTAAEVFAEGTGTSRDMAHVFVVGARMLGMPARYVSGHCLSERHDGLRPAPHGWAEAHIEGLGWVSFDPCAGLSTDDTHVRIAVALDAAGAAPVAGSRLGPGEERLDVDLNVGRVGGEG